jgi:hypothetical protein
LVRVVDRDKMIADLHYDSLLVVLTIDPILEVEVEFVGLGQFHQEGQGSGRCFKLMGVRPVRVP